MQAMDVLLMGVAAEVLMTVMEMRHITLIAAQRYQK